MKARRHLPADCPLLGVLLLAAFAALGSCRLVRPLEITEPETVAPEAPKARALFEASARGDLETVRELVEADPELLDAVDASGWDALSHAAWNAQHEIHEYLLQQGAKGNLFTEAALGPWQSFLQRLETNPIGVESRDKRMKATALIWAVRTGNEAGCEVLLSRGADIRARDREGNSAIHHAALLERLELIDFLLSAGAEVNGVNARGQSALHLAAEAGGFEACRLLLDGGATLDLADADGNTPLHIAAESGNLELCEYFLFLGARVSPKNRKGQTPLDLAAGQGYDRIVRLLEAQMR